jgi:hypothetical protein
MGLQSRLDRAYVQCAVILVNALVMRDETIVSSFRTGSGELLNVWREETEIAKLNGLPHLPVRMRVGSVAMARWAKLPASQAETICLFRLTLWQGLRQL